MSTVIVAGDLNAAVSTALDTDDEDVTDATREEKDADTLGDRTPRPSGRLQGYTPTNQSIYTPA